MVEFLSEWERVEQDICFGLIEAGAEEGMWPFKVSGGTIHTEFDIDYNAYKVLVEFASHRGIYAVVKVGRDDLLDMGALSMALYLSNVFEVLFRFGMELEPIPDNIILGEE